jgi:hypothetical protein
MALKIAVVLLGDDEPISVEAITRDIELRWTDLPYATAAEEDDRTVSFNLGSLGVAVGSMPAPWPWSDLEGPCSTSLFWPTAAAELKPLEYHWIVTVHDDAMTPVPLALMLTKITASILATCPSAVGVYWGHSTLVLPKALFVEVAEASSLRDPPLEMWVDFRVRWDGRRTSTGFTQGMRALGHMDFETQSAPESPAQLRERLVAMARYVVVGSGVIRDGDTVGKDAREKIRVSYSDSAFGNKHQVMRLTFAPAPKRRLW